MVRLVQVRVPARLVDRYGGEDATAARISRAAVLELLREGEMTSGEAAEALDLTRRDVLELMTQHEIPVANYNPAELDAELDTLKRLAP